MKAYSGVAVLTVTSCLIIFTFVTCSPKCVVRARVVDAETRQPIKGAAVAIKWYTDASAQQSAETVAAIQSLSDDMGEFKILEYPDKKYILGVYKNGYICWSSRNIFSNQEAAAIRKSYRQNELSLQQAAGYHVGFAKLRQWKGNCPIIIHPSCKQQGIQI